MSQAIRAVPANDADATPIPLPSAPPATVEARVDACRDDVRRVERRLLAVEKKLEEHAAASQRRDASTLRVAQSNTDELLSQRATLAAVASHFGIKGEAIVKEARITRAIALVRIPVLLAAGALLLRLVQAYAASKGVHP